jgi:hypothetical protein
MARDRWELLIWVSSMRGGSIKIRKLVEPTIEVSSMRER